jgi:phosphopantothenoylcysteine decarboxylase / phosphopantothenate---cysteine ligase
MAAAVADYRPAEARADKRPKDDAAWDLRLEPTDDILRELGTRSANGRVLVGFAAETGEDGLVRAREKRTGKNADLVVYNDVGGSDVGFESADNEVVLISEAGERKVDRAPKSRIAAEIWDEVERLLEENGGRAAG